MTDSARSCSGRRRLPQQPVEVTLPSEGREIDPTVAHEHALGRKKPYLLAEGTAAHRERDAAIGAQDTLPRQPGIVAVTEHVSDEPRATGQPRASCNLAIARDAAARDRRDRGADRGMTAMGLR